MPMVVIVFLVGYTLAHIFIADVIATDLHFGIAATALLTGILALCAVTPFVARRLERHGPLALARGLALFGYTWAGLVLLFVLARLATDLIAVGVALPGDRFAQPVVSGEGHLLLTLALTAVLAVYAFIERSRVRIERIELPTAKPMPGPRGLRIAQISDVHIGFMNGRRRVQTIIRCLHAIDADLVVSTGDLIDSPAGLQPATAALLATLNPPYGKFAIIGNHEYYAGLGRTLRFLAHAGFVVLRNECRVVKGFNLVGMDDIVTDNAANWARRESHILAAVPADAFTILLKHRPELVRGVQGCVDLQLSGHTHKGQIFPFNLLTRLYYPANAGLFRVAQTAYLYVSRGTGAWGPPFRLFSPPEITVFEIGAGRTDPGGRPLPRKLEFEVARPEWPAGKAPTAARNDGDLAPAGPVRATDHPPSF